MIPENVGQSGHLVVLSQGFVVQQPGGHSPAGYIDPGPLWGESGLALIHHPGKDYLVLIQGLKGAPLPGVHGVGALPETADLKAVTGDSGGVLKRPGQGSGQCRGIPLGGNHISGHDTLTSSPM